MTDIAAPPRRVRLEPSVGALLAGAERGGPWKTADSLSGSSFERVSWAGEPFIVKYVCVDDDWIMRATGDLHCRQLTLFESPLLDTLPATIDPVVVACAPYLSPRGRRGAALLMPDVSHRLIRSGDSQIGIQRHRQVLDHIAGMHAAYWGFRDDLGLIPLAHHFVILTPTMASIETSAPHHDSVPGAVRDGWAKMSALYPEDARALLDLANDPSPLVGILQRGPSTLLHGDLKFGNLGGDATATLLLDWDRCGQGPALVDLAWYLAVNCDRLPESKADAIGAYRASLEAHGVATASWWEAQLAAALAGAFLQLGWSKVGDREEFAWWRERFHEWQRGA